VALLFLVNDDAGTEGAAGPPGAVSSMTGAVCTVTYYMRHVHAWCRRSTKHMSRDSVVTCHCVNHDRCCL